MALDPFRKSPLFRYAPKEVQAIVHRNWRRSAIGQTVQEMERLGKTASGRQVEQAIDRFARRYSPEKMLEQLLGRDAVRMAKDVERYARGRGLTGKLLNQILGNLGPAGKLINALVSPATNRSVLNRELQVATDFLRAFGRLVVEPGDNRSTEAMADYLRSQGYTVLKPGEVLPGRPARTPESGGTGSSGGPISPTTGKPIPGRPAKTLTDLSRFEPEQPKHTVEVKIGTSKRRVRSDHPLVSGAMVPTPNSTNVHSVGYDLDTSYLYVRFLASLPNGRRTGPGSLYRYAGVSPEEFLGLYAVRNGGHGVGGESTPGTWLWSHLRIRGTISGHRKDYELVGVTRNYVPRKATLMPEGEYFLRRQVRSLEGNLMTSSRPNALVRPLAPISARGPRRT